MSGFIMRSLPAALALTWLAAVQAWAACPGPNDCFVGPNCDQYIGDGSVCTVDACGNGGNGTCGFVINNPVKQCRRRPGQESCPSVECFASSCPLPPGCDRPGLCIKQGTCEQSPAPGQACNDENLCTTNDTCIGAGNPVCVGTATPGIMCRAALGACDVAETCPAPNGTCPPDAFLPDTTVCRPSVGVCDAAETCTGTSAACPVDGLASNTTVCRAAAGPCDVVETCTGTSLACPPDAFAPDSTVCRAIAGVCDVAETCTGASAACPADAFVPNTTVCRAATGACDPADRCDGGGCITNRSAAGAACPDDGDICTDDVCDGRGVCGHPTNTAPCDDGDACTARDTCQAGVCMGSNDGRCGDPCLDAPDGTGCDDGNPCTASDACRDGTCIGRGTPSCDDADPCTADRCEPAAGCTHAPAPDGTPCDDGQPCTDSEACVDGTCANGIFTCGQLDTDPEVPVRGNDPVLKIKVATAGDEGGSEEGSCEVAGFLQTGTGPAVAPAASTGAHAVAAVESRAAPEVAVVLAATGAPTLGGQPSGIQVTRTLKRQLNRRGRVVLRLRLNSTGRQLLRGSGQLRVGLALRVNDRLGRSTTLRLTVDLLRLRQRG